MMDKLIGTIGQYCARHPWRILALYLSLAVFGTTYTVGHLQMDTDTSKLVRAEEKWRQNLTQYEKAFPQFQDLLIAVIDAPTSDMAREAAGLLEKAAKSNPTLFMDVRQVGGGSFFDEHGLLFLPTKDLKDIVNKIIRAQPFLANLTVDPSLRGLLATLDLALLGWESNTDQKTRNQILDSLRQIDQAITAATSENQPPMSWDRMIAGNDDPDPRSLRRLILMRPKQDFTKLQPAQAGIDFIRAKVLELDLAGYGVKVRITGGAALEAEEFATVAEGMSVAIVVSLLLVFVLLFLALRSGRLIAACLITLVVGLTLTFAFAALAIGSLNLISIAFAVMFIGLSIDFGIQYGVAFQHFRQIAGRDLYFVTGSNMARPLFLAAIAIAIGFLSFLPTAYRGVSELGLIAGAGMGFTLLLNLTLLPALIALLQPKAARGEMGFPWAKGLDHLLLRKRFVVLTAWAILSLAGAASLAQLRFDFNPLHLKDENSESVSTLYDLAKDKFSTPYPIVLMMENLDTAVAVGKKLKMLPEVSAAITAASFIPQLQSEKLPLLEDANLLLGVSLSPIDVQSPPHASELRQSLRTFAKNLREKLATQETALVIAKHFDALGDKDDSTLLRVNQSVIHHFPGAIALLKSQLASAEITLETLPIDLKRDWIASDGRALVVVLPNGNADSTETLSAFVQAVTDLSPNATGPAVQIYESARAIVRAFQQATLGAIAIIILLVYGMLRKIKDALLVSIPLIAAALVTSLAAWAIGLTVNYANIIALPLLLGIGVAFNIYFVVNWRRGVSHHLQTPTARAILFSALTTTASFAGLSLSAHRGTASMGILLLIGMAIILLTVLFLLPPLMGKSPYQAPNTAP